MLGQLEPSVTAKLAKVCGPLGSDHDGERAAAAAAATRILRDNGLSWADLVHGGGVLIGPAATSTAMRPQEIARRIVSEQRHLLSPWEVQFTTSLAQWRGRVTPKQAARLAQLRADLEIREAGR